MLNNFFPSPYFDLKMRENLIFAIAEKYPFVHHGVISKSLCERKIHYLQLGKRVNQVLFAATFHGMEWLTGLLVLTFFEKLCEKVQNNQIFYGLDIAKLLEQRGICIVPCVNPDGVEISLHGAETAGPYKNLVRSAANYGSTASWQANARGVDINHNFNAGWGRLHQMEIENDIIGPAPTRYGGPEPESEPETRAIVNLCQKENFRHAIAFHSQGEEIYWNYGPRTPLNSRLIANIMAKFSGYSVAKPEGLAVGGGFKDWFIEKLGSPGFTIEIGKGQNPLPIRDITPIYRTLEEMLVVCSLL